MTQENYDNQIWDLATMVQSTEHFARRLSDETGLPFDVVMDDMNTFKDKD